MDGKGEAIRNTTPDNSRTSGRISRSVTTVNIINDSSKALGSSLEKVQKEEKLKGERMKQKIDRKMQEDPQKGRGRNQGWGPDDD